MDKKKLYYILLGLSFTILLTSLVLRLVYEKDTPLYWVGLACYVAAMLGRPRKK